MGFPSPARDYLERRLSPEIICGINSNSLIIDTSSGYAVVDTSKQTGAVLLINFEGRNQFARVLGGAVITDDGEAIETIKGDALDDVTVIGCVEFFINSASVRDDEFPVM
jgi:DNA polymerase V